MARRSLILTLILFVLALIVTWSPVAAACYSCEGTYPNETCEAAGGGDSGKVSCTEWHIGGNTYCALEGSACTGVDCEDEGSGPGGDECQDIRVRFEVVPNGEPAILFASHPQAQLATHEQSLCHSNPASRG